MTTAVVNVRGRDRAALLADPRFVYVGRRSRGWPGSAFGNPLRPSGRSLVAARDCAAEYYRRLAMTALQARVAATHPDPEVRAALDPVRDPAWDRVWGAMVRGAPRLKGHALGCWCVDWDGSGDPPPVCHAVVLALWAEGRQDLLERMFPPCGR